jgi:hypothetical protein
MRKARAVPDREGGTPADPRPSAQELAPVQLRTSLHYLFRTEHPRSGAPLEAVIEQEEVAVQARRLLTRHARLELGEEH